MKTYYIMIHFDGPYVTGFVVPGAEDPAKALRILKRSIVARIKYCNERGIKQEIGLGDDNVPRLREYMRSLKRPWRYAGNVRKSGEKKAIPDRPRGAMVRIEELKTPVHTGYWLKDITLGKEYCNMRQSSSL